MHFCCWSFWFMKFNLVLLLVANVKATCSPCPSHCTCTSLISASSNGISDGITSETTCRANCSSAAFTKFPARKDFPANTSVINFHDNRLKTLSPSTFDGFTDLKELHLTNNKIECVEEGAFDSLQSLTNLNLSGNPWICNCNLAWFKQWTLDNAAKLQDDDPILCHSPLSLQNTSVMSANLSLAVCANSFVSCVWANNTKNFIVWKYSSEMTSPSNNRETCEDLCFGKKYFYAALHSDSCLCSGENSEEEIRSENVTEWTECNRSCDTVAPEYACQRKVLQSAVYHAAPQLHITGLRPYARTEKARFTVDTRGRTVDYFLWNFNDSTAVIMTRNMSVIHKYASAGVYWATVTAQQSEGMVTYSLMLKVEEPVTGVVLQCPDEVGTGDIPQTSLSITSGSSTYVSWAMRHDDNTISLDQTFCPSSSSFLRLQALCYKLFNATLTWSDARQACLNDHGSLAVINNSTVQDFITGLLASSDSKYWIGLSDYQLEGTYQFVNGYDLNETGYFNWATGQPDDALSTAPPQDCVVIGGSGEWYDEGCVSTHGYVCQYGSRETLKAPSHYIAGTVEFQDTTTDLVNVNRSTKSLNESEKYVLLFPGLSTYTEGVLTSWEVVAKKTVNLLRLQIYRPTCGYGLHLTPPGCKDSPYSSCNEEACSVQDTVCEEGYYYCYFNTSTKQHCRTPSAPCNWYDKYTTNGVARHKDRVSNYTLVVDDPVDAGRTGKHLYQFSLNSPKKINSNDVLGLGFSFANPPSDILESLPVQCKNSSRNSWSQSAMLCSVAGWGNVTYDSATCKWLDYIWCDVRFHYSKRSPPHVSSSQFLSQNEPGTYSYIANVFNDVTTLDRSSMSAACEITVTDRVQGLELLHPVTHQEGDEIIVYVARGENVTFAVKIVGGDSATQTNWTATTDDIDVHSYQDRNASTTCNASQCDATSESPIIFESVGNSSLEIVSRNSLSRTSITVKVVTEEAITGATITPVGVTRVLSGIQKTFSSEWSTGTNVTTQWMVDNLEQFKLTQPTYNVLFRKPSSYTLKMFLINHVSTGNDSIDLTVEDMNKLSRPAITAPSVVEANTTINMTMTVTADKDVPVLVEWEIDDLLESTKQFNLPHSVVAGSNLVELEDTFDFTFPIGLQSVKVTAKNDYDLSSNSIEVDARSRLTELTLQLMTDLVVSEISKVRVSFSPRFMTKITVGWGEGSTLDVTNTSTDLDVEHTFSRLGTFNLTVEADNEINTISRFKVIEVFEKISDVTIDVGQAVELGQTANFSIDVVGGGASNITVQFGDGNSSDPVSSPASVTHDYGQVDIFNATVIASNAVSTVIKSVLITVFQLEIVRVDVIEVCYAVNETAGIEVTMPVNDSTLFRFKWQFDKTVNDNVTSDDPQSTHIYNSAGMYDGIVTAFSLQTGASAAEEFTVCVQQVAADVRISSTRPHNASATGDPHTFHYEVNYGTDLSTRVLFGDGSSQNLTGATGGVSHTYNAADNYTVTLIAKNLVSEANVTTVIIAQVPVSNVSITTSSPYEFEIAKGHNITYTAHYVGTDVSIAWKFGGTPVTANGDQVTHVYNHIDNFLVTAIATNLVSTITKDQVISVKAPVERVAVAGAPSIVVKNTLVWFNITSRGNAETFTWKITPVLSGEWNVKLTRLHFSHLFDVAGNYSITIMAENSASSQDFTIPLLVASKLGDLTITSNEVRRTRFAGVGELLTFQVLLLDGLNSVLTTTSGVEEFVTVEWMIDGVVQDPTNFTEFSHTFPSTDEYIINVTVSNTVSTKHAELDLNVIQRITNLTIDKLDPPSNAAITGEQVRLQANILTGSRERYVWKSHHDAPASDDGGYLFTYTYQQPSSYVVSLVVENPLGSVSLTYTIYVQDEIAGLSVKHLNAVVPFYVGAYTNSLFEASVTSGSNVFYAWQFIAPGGHSDQTKYEAHGTVNWNFTQPGLIYTMVIKGRNLVGSDEKNTTVHVIVPISGFDVSSSGSPVAVNTEVEIFANVSSGTGVTFTVDFGDGSGPVPATEVSSTSAKASRTFTSTDTYQVIVEAKSNATVLNKSLNISVREPITGLQISGLPTGRFIRSDQSYLLQAIVSTGSDFDPEWSLTFADASVDTFTGVQYPLSTTVLGIISIEVTADNQITSESISSSVTVQDPPLVSIRSNNTGKIYINDNVTFIITVKGTDVRHNISFGDNTQLTTSDTIVTHSYASEDTYLVTLVSFNGAAKDEKQITVTIGKLACVKPKLSFVGTGGAELSKFYRSRKVYIETEIDTFGCNAYKVNYEWNIYKQSSCDNLNENNLQNLLLVRNPLLVLSPLTLLVGKYCVTCSASFDGTPLANTVSTEIEVISTPLAVVIEGGTERFVSRSSKIILDASSSFDPDLPLNKQTVIYYTWRCTSEPAQSDDTDDFARESDNCFSNKTDPTIEFPQSTFIIGRKYNFTVQASKPGKSLISSWQSVTIVGFEIPSVTISCVSCRQQSSLQASSAHHLILLGSCESCDRKEIVYAWEATRRQSGENVSTPFVLDSTTTTTGVNGKYLVVRPGAMLSYYEYEFKLTITKKIEGASGFSKLVLYSNRPPENGNCSLSYDGPNIYVLETLVTFECSGWEDEDISLLVYKILAIRYNQGVKVDDFVIYRGTSSLYQAYLPVGFRDNNYDVMIQMLVEDELGTFSVGLNQSINVVLSPTSEENIIEWLRNKTYGSLAELQKSSNPQRVADYAAGLITVLNQDSEQVTLAGENNDFESRKEIRNNITRIVTSLSAHTLDEIQQVTTVFKQCMKVPSELQDVELQNISMSKLLELADQMPEYVDVASSTTFITVTVNLMDIVSYMVDSVNYPVYTSGHAQLLTESQGLSTLSEIYRKEMVEQLMTSALNLTDTVLDGRVEGEEPFFLNASALSSVGARTTPATMNSSVVNDGCFFQFPHRVFVNVSDDTEIRYIFVVAEQNPYTFGYQPTPLSAAGVANISTRVPSFQFKYANNNVLDIKELVKDPNLATDSSWIKMVMGPNTRQFIDNSATTKIVEGGSYNPWDHPSLQNFSLSGLISTGVTVKNNNTVANTAVHIMVVYRIGTPSEKAEATPHLDVYFGFNPSPNAENHSEHLVLNADSESSYHTNYTIYLDPEAGMNTLAEYHLNISSYYKYTVVEVGVVVYYSSCQFYNTATHQWSSQGLTTSPDTVPSAAVCYSSHLTSFGAFVISPPNIIDINEIKNLNFAENPVALIVVVVLVAIYLVAAVRCRQLDLQDIKKASSVPLCGPNGSFKYEITIKTSAGIGSGTTANVGICIYGYESQSRSKHLHKPSAFERGSVDVFQIATEINLGVIYKIKIWHDNTGLDPEWNVSRVMVRDLQTGEKFYFLVDAWLQVYPDDDDVTCLQKTVEVATDDDLSNLSLRFGSQLAYGWEDVHLWLSLVERPATSRFTRVQRLTCCFTLLFTFIVLSAFWYQGYYDDASDVFATVIRGQDIAVGVIVTVMVFPINMLIVLCFKKSKCKVAAIKSWPDRTQTAQTVEILDEVLDPKRHRSLASFKHSDYSTMPTDATSFTTLPGQSIADDAESKVSKVTKRGLHKTSGTVKSLDIKDKLWLPVDSADDLRNLSDSPTQFTSDDTGISSAEDLSLPSYETKTCVEKAQFYQDSDDDDDDDYWDVMSESSVPDSSKFSSRPSNLKRTRKAKFEEDDALDDTDDVIVSFRHTSRADDEDDRSQSHASMIFEPHSTDEFLLPHQFIYVAYFLCFAGMAVSIFFIILYGHVFGVEKATHWLVSMVVSLLGSFLIIEPIKVLFVAAYISFFTKRDLPENSETMVDKPFIDSFEHEKKVSKVRPPGGFALEQCKDQVKKSSRAKKLQWMLVLHSILLSSLLVSTYYDRLGSPYWSSWSMNNVLFKNSYPCAGNNGTDCSTTFEQIKTVEDVWAWIDQALLPNLFPDPSFYLDVGNFQAFLLGKVRIRQQRYVSGSCPASKKYSENFSTRSCLPPSSEDQGLYGANWSGVAGNNSAWSFDPNTDSVGYWGLNRVYDGTGYAVYINASNYADEVNELKMGGWLDRFTKVCIIEFTHLVPPTQWFVVSTIMFEVGGTGVVQPSYISQTVRLFLPSAGVYVDMIFMAIFGVIGIVLWVREVYKIWQARNSPDVYAMKATNWMNILVIFLITTTCGLYICKETLMQGSMQAYLNDRSAFHNFYNFAFYSDLVMYMSSITLAVLIIKLARLLRFSKRWSAFGDTIMLGFRHLLGTCIMLMILILAYAQLGYLIFGMTSPQAIEAFQDFPNSLFSMFLAFRGRLNTRQCFEAYQAFTIIFFLSYYFGIFIIFCRLFAAILNKGYKEVRAKQKRRSSSVPDYEILQFMITRLKMRLGIIKPKQYRPTVRFEGMSTPSSRGSFSSIDSFGTCFTPGRISQCSDASGLSASSSDSGLGTPSDHSLSLFDYLTIETPPSEKPMDSVHLDYLCERISLYSVNMLLHRFDRVNKLSDDIHKIEAKLLEVTQKSQQKKVLKKQSTDIAAATGSLFTPEPDNNGVDPSKPDLYRNDIPSRSSLADESRLNTVIQSIFPEHHPPVRSRSYAEGIVFEDRANKRGHVTSASAAHRSETTVLVKRRPHSDEGARKQAKRDEPKVSVATKRSAW